jgi:uncharacterized protein (DUF58 family)
MPSPRSEAIALAERYRLGLAHEPRRGAAGERLGRTAGSSLEFHDRRAYQAGDDVRHLDWRAFARTDQLLVRQYREEILPRLELIVDASRSMRVEEAKGRLLVDLAALLAIAARASGFEVATIPLGNAPEHLPEDRLLRDGLPLDGRTPLAAAIRDAGPLLRHGSLRILLSDFLSPHDAPSLLRKLATRTGGLVLIQILGEEDANPPADTALRMTDSESGAELDLVIDDRLRNRYLERLSRLTAALETESRRAGALFLSIGSSTSLETICRDVLACRGILEPA